MKSSTCKNIRSLIVICFALSVHCLASAQGGFSYTGSMIGDRYYSTVVLLTGGKAFAAGGRSTATSTTELYDPSTGVWSAGGNLIQARFGAVTAPLNDGRVLIIGGWTGSANADKIEIYDPVTNTAYLAGYLSTARVYARAITLNDGRVFITGGTYNSGGAGPYHPSAWIFNPSDNSLLQVTTVARLSSALTKLSDGKILITGGKNNSGNAVTTVEVFDPAGNTVTALGNMSVARVAHTATLLANGKVFLCGGDTGSDAGGGGSALTKKCDVYDPSTGTVVQTYDMSTARWRHWAARLSDGRVIIDGDEIFDSATALFSASSDGPLVASRVSAAAITLQDSRILVAAGLNPTAFVPQCELFTPTGWGQNLAPVANAGPDQVIYVGTETQGAVTLNGSSSSDPEGQPLTYSWSGAFGTTTGATPSVTLPTGIHSITLTVTDNFNLSGSVTTKIAIVQGIDSAGYAQIQAQLQQLTAENQQLTQKNASLTSLLQNLYQAFDQIQGLAATIGATSQEKKDAINQALGN